MEAAESLLKAGYRLDRYELLCPIASGGMATVWLARLRGKRGFEKLYAIKTIRTELVDDPRFQEMFLDEARIASGIQHPNVAQILDLGEQQDVLFIVMEWVDGDSLAKIRKLVAKRGHRLPVGVVLRLLADACAGLHAAHELYDDQGQPLAIVHRDVSPQNLLVSTAGAVKVIDFGIAKAQNRKQGETRTGVVKGKIQYMAPEQVKKGRTVDRRADVWSLGVCLHELVSGKLPYDGDDDIEVINKLLSDEPPRIAEGVPEPIARVLERSMVLDADARFPTAAGMQRALEAVTKELGETTTTEDVAAFLRSELPELANKRREIVNRAVDDARERGTPAAVDSGDVAFAPTVVSERQPAGAGKPAMDRPSDAGTIPLAKRKEPPRKEPPPATNVSVALDQEPFEIPKKSKAWLWILLVLLVGAGGAYYQWPNEVKGLLAKLGIGGSTGEGSPQLVVVPDPSATPSAAASASAPPTTTESAPPATSAPPAPSAAASQALPPQPSASASSGHPEPGGTHHTWPGGQQPSAKPSASAPPPVPTTTWSPYKTSPAPSESTDNPYQHAPPL
jgi:serine/threonine-protein kinase